MPSSNNLIKQSGIPFGVHLTPFHFLEAQGEEDVIFILI
jgi:hypothetical protein